MILVFTLKRSTWRHARLKRFTAPGALFLLGCVMLIGCQTERVTTSDSRPMPPDPRPAPVPPATARADRMVFMVGSKPEDTNNNGFPDAIKATVVLFSSQHPTALREQGAFVFTLYQRGQFGMSGAAPLGTWRIEGDALPPTYSTAQYGPCYQFQLSLFDIGGDMLPLDRADLICEFFPAESNGASVRSDGVRTIQIGSRFSAATPAAH